MSSHEAESAGAPAPSSSGATNLSIVGGSVRNDELMRPAKSFPRNHALVIVSDADMRRYVSDSLSLDYEVVAATSVGHAMNIVGRIRPDVIVCDLVLRDGCGLNLREAISHDPVFAGIAFVIISGRTEPHHQADFLAMPFSRRTLLDAVRHARRN